jgi:hypothetical protein
MFEDIHIPRLPPDHPFHEDTQARRIAPRVNHQMHIVGHQAIGIELTSQLLFPFPQIIEILQVIAIVRKGHLAIMSTLDHMMGKMRRIIRAVRGMGEKNSRHASKNKSVAFFLSLYSTR